jgi:hypothetical protein
MGKMRTLKIILISISLLIGLFFSLIWYYSWQDIIFYNIEIGKGENYQKPIEHLNYVQVDSIENLKITSEKIEVSGTGYRGYDFYMWHKSTENGDIYIKVCEVTKNRRLSEQKLTERTKIP